MGTGKREIFESSGMELDYVIDTNIAMSFIIGAKASYKPLIKAYNFVLPDFGLIEIDKYQHLIFEKTRQTDKQILDFSYFLFSEISIFPNYILQKQTIKQALELTKDIDIKDVAFVALSLQLNFPLLTRDKKLVAGLKKKKHNKIELFSDFLQNVGI